MQPARRLLPLLICLLPSTSFSAPEWELLRVNGSSMEPTIHHGDMVCLHRGTSEFNIGDLVAIQLSDDKPPLLKRVVAIAGDKVEIIDGRIRRNGTVVAMRPEGKKLSALEIQLSHYGSIVPANSLIALGDNAELSFDSSDFGLLHQNQLAGTVLTDLSECRSNPVNLIPSRSVPPRLL